MAHNISTDLVYKTLGPLRIVGGKSPAIILLHGRGADENDLLGLSHYLDDRLAVFSIRAPYPFEFGGFTYFRLDEDGTAEPVMFKESHSHLAKFVDGVALQPGIDAQRIFLMGFSMGTIMAYALSLTRPEKFAGVIAQSGFVRDHPEMHFRWNELSGCPFIITHGVHDPIIPISLARKTKEMFVTSNAKVEYKEYDMGHEISQESLSDVVAWLKERLR